MVSPTNRHTGVKYLQYAVATTFFDFSIGRLLKYNIEGNLNKNPMATNEIAKNNITRVRTVKNFVIKKLLLPFSNAFCPSIIDGTIAKGVNITIAISDK